METNKFLRLALECKKNHSLNDSRQRKRDYLAITKLFALLRGVSQNIMMILIVWIVFIRLEQKTHLNHIKKYVKIETFVVLQSQMKKRKY